MHSVYPARSATAHLPAQAGIRQDVLETVQAELARLHPGLDPRSPRGKMAVLVMAAAATGRNVDRLSRITRIERETVAKFCRRLFDAGIDLAGMGTGHRDFWNVVGLAEGRLARRVDDQGGMEWVPVGAVPREVGHDWPATDPARRRDGGAAREDGEPLAPSRGWGEARGDRDARAVPGAAAAVELFPEAEWLT